MQDAGLKIAQALSLKAAHALYRPNVDLYKYDCPMAIYLEPIQRLSVLIRKKFEIGGPDTADQIQ
jgi:hypothetical protein